MVRTSSRFLHLFIYTMHVYLNKSRNLAMTFNILIVKHTVISEAAVAHKTIRYLQIFRLLPAEFCTCETER